MRLSSHHRYLWLGCAVLAGSSGCLFHHGAADAGMTAFVPSDSIVLAGINLDRLRTTPLYRRLDAHNRVPRFDQFSAGSGINPTRDIQQLLVASDGQNALAIARGTFAQKPSDDYGESQYRGAKLYMRGGETIALIGKSLALGGQTAAVRAAIDQSKSGGRGPRALLARAENLPANAQIWAVVAGWRGLDPGEVRALGNLGNFDRVLRLAYTASLSADFSNGVHILFQSDSRTSSDATHLADSIRGLATLARIESTQVEQSGAVVKVKIDIPEDTAEKWIK